MSTTPNTNESESVTEPIVYSAGWNLSGYLPEMEPYATNSFESARLFILEELERSADGYAMAADDDNNYAAEMQEIDGASAFLSEAAEGPWSMFVGNLTYWIEVIGSGTVDQCEKCDREFIRPTAHEYAVRCDECANDYAALNMRSDRVTTTGVMFDEFPSLAVIIRSNWLNSYLVGDVEAIDNWRVIAWNPSILMYGEEDREAMDETNFAAILSGLSIDEAELPSIHTMYRGSRGDETVGVDDAIAYGFAMVDNRVLIMAPNHEALDEAKNLHKALADYPLLDESAYSEREWAAWCEYAPQAFRDELIEAVRDDEMTDEEADRLEDRSEELVAILGSQMNYHDGFSGEYSPKFLELLVTLEDVDSDAEPWIRRSAEELAIALADCVDGHPEPVAADERSVDGKFRCHVHGETFRATTEPLF